MTELNFAYSLSQELFGWVWRVLNEDGETVDRGALPNQSDAQAAAEDSIRRVSRQYA